MANRWILTALLVCGLTQSVQAQWGFDGLDADPRYDPNVAGNAAAEATSNIPSVDITAGYLAWWFRAPRLSSPVVTTGAPGNQVLAGTDTINNDDPYSGGQLRARFWCDSSQTGSVEFAGFILAQRSNENFYVANATTPNVAIPGNLLIGGNSAIISSPASAGGIRVATPSYLWGCEGNFVVNTLSPLDLFVGYRYVDLSESLDIDFRNTIVATNTLNANSDHFATRNQFNGGQVGARGTVRLGMFTFTGLAKVAAGSNHETVIVAGTASSSTLGGPLVTTNGGLVANRTNIGRYSRDRFCLIPEAEARVAIDLADGWQLFVGYSYLYMSHVVRPGDQLPQTPPPGTTPLTGVVPSIPFIESSFWAQGVTIGLEVRY